MRSGRRAFTLIELMVTVAIIGLLLSIAIPKFADMVRTATEANTKANLGAIRSALTQYYGDMEGEFPAVLSAITVGGRYLRTLPRAKTPSYHADTDAVTQGAGIVSASDAGGWFFNNNRDNVRYGETLVNCTHTDSRHDFWTHY